MIDQPQLNRSIKDSPLESDRKLRITHNDKEVWDDYKYLVHFPINEITITKDFSLLPSAEKAIKQKNNIEKNFFVI